MCRIRRILVKRSTLSMAVGNLAKFATKNQACCSKICVPDFSLRVPKTAFPSDLPMLGERIEVEGDEYRIAQVANHPRSPLLTFSLATTDE